jgi:hypothetical protein
MGTLEVLTMEGFSFQDLKYAFHPSIEGYRRLWVNGPKRFDAWLGFVQRCVIFGFVMSVFSDLGFPDIFGRTGTCATIGVILALGFTAFL